MLLNCGAGEDSWESLGLQRDQTNRSKGNQPWAFKGRTDAEAEAPILWPPDVKIWLIGKDPDAGKDWGQEEKGTTDVEMVGWHHRLDGHGFGWTLGVGDGQGGLACCNSWSRKKSDMTEAPSWTELMHIYTEAENYMIYQLLFQRRSYRWQAIQVIWKNSTNTLYRTIYNPIIEMHVIVVTVK